MAAQQKTSSCLTRKIFNGLYLVLALVMFIVGVYAICIRLKYVERTSNDLMQDYSAITRLIVGESIYKEEQGSSSPNYHPPTVAALLRPLARFTYRQVAILWSLFTLACLFIQAWIILKTLEIHLSKRWLLLLLGLLLCWYPVQGHIAIGQFSIPIALLLTAGWMQLRTDRQISAGVLIGLSCLLKLFPGLLFILLVLRRKWYALGAMFTTIVAGYLFTLFVVGVEDTWLYFHTLIAKDTAIFSAFPLNLSLHGVFSRLFTRSVWIAPLAEAPFLATLLTAIMSLALLVVLIYQTWHLPESELGGDLAYGLHLIAMLLLSPLTWWHSFVLLLLPFALLLTAREIRKRRGLPMLLLLAFGLLSLPDVLIARFLMGHYAPYQPPWYAGLLMILTTLGVLLLYGIQTFQASLLIRGSDGSFNWG